MIPLLTSDLSLVEHKCKSAMQIVAALADEREINKIMQSFGIPAPEPPLKIQTKDDQFSEIIDPTFDEF